VTTQIFRGVLTQNMSAVTQGFDVVWSTLYYSKRDDDTIYEEWDMMFGDC
jgi:hypothetical protein